MPHCLVLCLVGNDLGLVNNKDLVIQPKDYLRVVQECWPGVQISLVCNDTSAFME